MNKPSSDLLEQVKAYLRENLRIEVKTTSVYQGDMSDGPLYANAHTLKLVLGDEIISEVDL